MKERLDILIVQKGLFDTREKAKKAITAGLVVVNNKKITKAGAQIKWDEVEPEIKIEGQVLKYASRGGLKLEKAIEIWSLDFTEKDVLDVGSSTGGFTDCSLQHGAGFVYAVDVGTDQLVPRLRNHEKVKSIEGMHIKNLTAEDLDGKKVNYVVMDVSFISITKVFEYLVKFMKPEAKLMALIKPQFEVGRENIEKGGLVKDKKKHKMAINSIIEKANSFGLYIEELDCSPITGGKGNIEYISLFSLKEPNKDIDIDKVIKSSKVLNS